MKKHLKLILILVCIAMAFTGVVIWCAMQKQNDLEENIVVEVNGETDKTFKAELAGFYPGSKREYKIALEGDAAENYTVTLNFRYGKERGELERYLTVKIATRDVTVEKTLTELLEGDSIDLGKNADEITITYVMSVDVGNETQGTVADFYMDLTAENAK